MKAAFTRFNVEAEENHKVVERLVATQNESDAANQNKIKRLEESIIKFNGSIEQKLEELNEETDNNILQLTKQVVNFDTKTSSLENLVQSVMDETKVKYKEVIVYKEVILFDIIYAIVT